MNYDPHAVMQQCLYGDVLLDNICIIGYGLALASQLLGKVVQTN